MTIEQYNKKANEYNTKLSALRSALPSCDAKIIQIDSDGENDLSSWKADSMYRGELMLAGLGTEIKYLSQKMTELNATYFEILIENEQ
jgi:hypothetical protein